MSDKKFYKEGEMCKYVPAKASYEHLPSAVISFYAVKGCNTTSFILGHTKKTAREVLLENPGLLSNIGVGIMTKRYLLCQGIHP